jgi:hypothetical protein
VKEEEERKREEEGRGPKAFVEWTGVIESCHGKRHDSGGMTQATWRVLCRGGAYSHQCKWHDSFMSRANRTGMIEKGQIWKQKFGRVHFLNFNLKKPKYKKIQTGGGAILFAVV